MTTRRTAAIAATALAALTTSGVLLASAGTASGQDQPDGANASAVVPGLTWRHQLMAEQNPGMSRMHELVTEQDPGMARMHRLMTDGPR